MAAISAHKIPEDIQDKQILARLPVFFRAIRDKEISDEDLDKLIDKIKES